MFRTKCHSKNTKIERKGRVKKNEALSMNSKRKSQCKRQVLSGPLLHFWFCTMTIVSFLEWEKEQKVIFTGKQLGETVFEEATIL